jgi:hypothetical protein
MCVIGITSATPAASAVGHIVAAAAPIAVYGVAAAEWVLLNEPTHNL